MFEVLIGYTWPYLERFGPMLIGGALALIGARSMSKKRRISDLDRAAMGDGMLIACAIDEVGGDGPKETYLKVSVLMELEKLTKAYLHSDRLRFILGSIYLSAGFVSIAVTGTDAFWPGVANTSKLAFAVNIVGEVASGFLIFGGFEAKEAAAFQLAELIRLEVSQFIAQSQEYHEQTPEHRWFLLTQTIENLRLKAILPAPQGKGDRKSEDQESIEGDPLV
jgi:hypothetical protein